MMIRDKNNIFERVENFHADLAWNYPSSFCCFRGCRCFCSFDFVLLVVYFGDTFSFVVFNDVVFIEQCLA